MLPIIQFSTLLDLPLYYLAFIALLPACVLIAIIRSRLYHLDHVPGPFISKYTALYRAISAFRNPGPETNMFMQLHEKYGDTVRVSPRSVSCVDPEALPLVYGVKARLDKGPAYTAITVPDAPSGNILAMIDEETHGRYRRPIQNAYSLSNLKRYEPYADVTIQQLDDIIDRYVKEGKPINIAALLYYWSYDTVGKLTFGSTTGYLDHESDFNGLIQLQQNFRKYLNLVPQMPVLKHFFLNNPLLKLIPQKPLDFIIFTKAKVNERLASNDKRDQGRPDLLSHFIAAKETHGDIVTDEQVFAYTLINVIGGSLSSSHVLNDIISWLVFHPDAQERIRQEVRGPDGQTHFPVPFDWARKSLLLEGVILEGYRLHNVGNVLLERVVGPQGMTLPNGMYLPPGTLVGANTGIVNKNRGVYGADADEFNPLRWRKSDNEIEEEYVARRGRMDRTLISFGMGSRSCLGKNIVQLEMFKVISAIISRYRFIGIGEPQLFDVQAKVVRVD